MKLTDYIGFSVIADGGKDADGVYCSFSVFGVRKNGKRELVHASERIALEGTSNTAEYDAVLMSLRHMWQYHKMAKYQGYRMKVTINTDSDLVIHQVDGSFKVKAKHLVAKRDLVKKAFESMPQFKFNLNKVERDVCVRVLGH